jgi:hypothetical protein
MGSFFIFIPYDLIRGCIELYDCILTTICIPANNLSLKGHALVSISVNNLFIIAMRCCYNLAKKKTTPMETGLTLLLIFLMFLMKSDFSKPISGTLFLILSACLVSDVKPFII